MEGVGVVGSRDRCLSLRKRGTREETLDPNTKGPDDKKSTTKNSEGTKRRRQTTVSVAGPVIRRTCREWGSRDTPTPSSRTDRTKRSTIDTTKIPENGCDYYDEFTGLKRGGVPETYFPDWGSCQDQVSRTGPTPHLRPAPRTGITGKEWR